MHNVYTYKILFQMESKSEPFQAVLFTIYLGQIVFRVVDSFSETVHHSSNT